MSNELAKVAPFNPVTDLSKEDAALAAEAATVGDLSALSPEKRTHLYGAICRSVGLNPLTKPFEYIKLNGKLTLYALKGATDQLRKVNGISITRIEKQAVNGILMVTAYAEDASGRTDSDMGAVPIGNLQGEALANAHMKAITKAKRRVTLSISGLGWLDESELDSIPPQRAQSVHVNMDTGEIGQWPEGTSPEEADYRREDEQDRVEALKDLLGAANAHGISEGDVELYFEYAGIDAETVTVERMNKIEKGIRTNTKAFEDAVEKAKAMRALNPSADELGA